MPDAQGRMTNLDYAAKVRQQGPEQPFAFSEYTGHRPAMRGWFEWPDEADQPHDGPPLPTRVGCVRAPRLETSYVPDQQWDIEYTTKFSKTPDPDEPPVQPRGTIAAMQGFEDPITELNYLLETQCCAYHTAGGTNITHSSRPRDLATDYQTMKANQLAVVDIGTIDVAAGRTAPYVVRIKDDVMLDPDTGEEVCVPRYANMTYIANMLRRIDWERWRAQNGPLHRARFTPTKDGGVGIICLGKHESADELTEHKRALKRYYDAHDWPYPEAHECYVYDKNNPHQLSSLLPRLDEREYDEYIRSKMFGNEDDDPWRHEFHGNPNPKPLRGQYAYGDHRYCRIGDDGFTVKHNGCTEDGDELFALDLQTWEHAVPDDEVGYAGPTGYLYSDSDELATPDRQVTPTNPWILTVHGLDEDTDD